MPASQPAARKSTAVPTARNTKSRAKAAPKTSAAKARGKPSLADQAAASSKKKGSQAAPKLKGHEQAAAPQLKVATKFMHHFEEASSLSVFVNAQTNSTEACVVARDEAVPKSEWCVWHLCPDAANGLPRQTKIPGLFGDQVTICNDGAGRVLVIAAEGLKLRYAYRMAGNRNWVAPWSAALTLTVTPPKDAEKIVAIHTGPGGHPKHAPLLVGLVYQLTSGQYRVCYGVWNGAWNKDEFWAFYSPTLSHELADANVRYWPYAFGPALWGYPARAPAAGGGRRTLAVRDFTAAGDNGGFAVLEDGRLYHLAQERRTYLATPLTKGEVVVQAKTLWQRGAQARHLLYVTDKGELFHQAIKPVELPPYKEARALIKEAGEVVRIDAWLEGENDVRVIAVARTPGEPGKLRTLRLSGTPTDSKYKYRWTCEVISAGLNVHKRSEQRISYSTDVTVTQLGGALAIKQEVTIRASDEVLLTVNGRQMAVGPDADGHAKATTNLAGMLAIGVPTNLLSVPTLQISVPGVTKPGEWLTIEQSRDVEKKLGAITGDQLRDAKDGSGQPLLPDEVRNNKESREDLANVFQGAFNTAHEKPRLNARNAALFQRASPGEGVWIASGKKPPSRLFAPPKDYRWDLVFNEDGTTTTRRLAAGEPARLEKQLLKQHPPVPMRPGLAQKSLAVPAAANSIFGDIFDTITDFVKSVVDGVTKLMRAVIDGASIVFTFIIDGVTSVLKFVIKTVGDAFDFVVGVFKSIGVAFKKAFEFLGTLLNWGDILRTQDAVVHLVNEFFGFAEASRKDLQKRAHQVFGKAKEDVTRVFGGLKEKFARKSLGEVEKQNHRDSEDLNSATANNVAANGVANGGGGEETAKIQLLRANDPDIETLKKRMDDLSSKHSSSAAFQRAKKSMDTICSEPGRILSEGLVLILELLEGIVLTVLEGVQALLDCIFDLMKTLLRGFKDALNKVWEIPVVTALFRLISGGKDLTLLNLIGLIVAIPSTILFKVLKKGKAPFATEAALTSFKQSFRMRSLSKLTSSAPPLSLRSESAETVSEWRIFLQSVTVTAGFIGIGLAAAVDIMAPEKEAEELEDVATYLELLEMAAAFPFFHESDPAPAEMMMYCTEVTGFIAGHIVSLGHDHHAVPRVDDPRPLLTDVVFSGIKASLMRTVHGHGKHAELAFWGGILGQLPSVTRLFRLLRLPWAKGVACLGTIFCGLGSLGIEFYIYLDEIDHPPHLALREA